MLILKKPDLQQRVLSMAGSEDIFTGDSAKGPKLSVACDSEFPVVLLNFSHH